MTQETPVSPAPHSDHYREFKIEPIQYIMANNLNFLEGCVIKYVTRFRQKNGKADLEKAQWYLGQLIAQEYGNLIPDAKATTMIASAVGGSSRTITSGKH